MGRADIHCHILPAVDDGAESMSESTAMLNAALSLGVDKIIATPHLKTTNADVQAMRSRYEEMRLPFLQQGVELLLGFECHYRLLLYLPPEAFKSYCIAGTDLLLLEFPSRELPLNWEHSINELQSRGINIIIAHPERYQAIQNDPDTAIRIAEIGCELQLSSDSLCDGLFSPRRKCAIRLLKEGLVNYIASDAHCAEDYRHYAKAMDKYASLIRPGTLV